MVTTTSIEGGPSFTVAPGETLLAAALRARVGFPYDCSSGGCGNCKFDLVSGSVNNLWPDAPGLSERDRKRGKLLGCQCTTNDDCVIKVRTGEEYVPPVEPSKRRAVLTAIRDVTHDLREFTLAADGAADFLPGQYARVSTGSAAWPRAYSMSNLPNSQGVWQFIVRRVPGGGFSNALFDEVSVGDTFDIEGPYGRAFLRTDSPRDIVCIAGGSGLAPMLSIARGALALSPGRHIHFYFGARTPRDVFSHDEISFLANASAPSRSTMVVSSPESDWTGPSGFVHETVEKDLGNGLENLEIYLAGPPAMVDAVQEMLFLRHKVPVDQVHLDRFF